MTTCQKCKKIIGVSAPVYNASRGCVDNEGTFYEDEGTVFHTECMGYTFEPFGVLEDIIKNG